jgi:hypothetical protein
VKTTIIALSAAALIAVTPAVLAQGVANKTPGLQHKVSEKHHARISGYAPLREMQAKGSRRYPGAFGYVPAEPSGLNRDLEASRQAGGGGGGGGGGM